MRGGDGATGKIANEREMQKIGVEVQDVEIVCPLADLVHHHDMIGHMVVDCRVKAQRDIAAAHKLSGAI